jgi:hypothetical protein
MRLLLVGLALVPVTLAACGGVSAYPPGADEDDASASPPETGTSGSSGSSGSSGGPVHDDGGVAFDASHPHDAAAADAGPVDGVCPKTCTDEPTGVPPCIAPERSCNCSASAPAPVGCAPATGLAGVYCCGS